MGHGVANTETFIAPFSLLTSYDTTEGSLKKKAIKVRECVCLSQYLPLQGQPHRVSTIVEKITIQFQEIPRSAATGGGVDQN